MTPLKSPERRLAVAAGLLATVLLSCGREITAPGTVPVNAFHRFGSLAFSAQYDTPARGPALLAALTQVAFERVRVVLRREDGTVVVDTMVNFPVGADTLTLSFRVPLPAGTPATGATFSLSLAYVNAAGDTVFKGGPVPVTIIPSGGPGNAAPVQVPVQYTGVGSNAVSVSLLPKSLGGMAGQSATLTAQARDAAGQVIPQTPLVFSSANPAVAQIPNSNEPTVSFVGRGTAFVYVQLLTGPRDSALVTVTLPASRLTAASGDGQSALVSRTLAQPIVAKVGAVDGIGVGGVSVAFSAANGGSVSPASATTTADGLASTTWTLGPGSGSQTLTVTAAGMQGSPLTFTATAKTVVPTRLVLKSQAPNGTTGKPLAALTVEAQDADGNVAPLYTGLVTATLGGGATNATLAGTTTVSASGGVATFSDLAIAKAGAGYVLTFSAGNLTPALSNSFDVTAEPATQLRFASQPALAWSVGVTGSFSVELADAHGTRVTTATTTPVVLSIATGPAGATLSGTTTVVPTDGVATFPNVLFKRAGAYTLLFTSGTLTSLTSPTINVVNGVASRIASVWGDAQRATAGTALPLALIAQVTDTLNNPVASTSVTWTVTGGGGSISNVTTMSDAQGLVQAQLVLGPKAGTNTVTAAITDLNGVAATFTAQGTADLATKLLVTTQPSTTQSAGVSSGTIRVAAVDASNNLASSFAGYVKGKIASGPSGATMVGTDSALLVAGVASFDFAFDKMGTYTLAFSSAGLDGTTSSSFTVGPGPARYLVMDTGDGQTASTGQTLPVPISALITDVYGNPVPGRSVTWAVASGVGSLTNTVIVSDTSGRVKADWTLGTAEGKQTATVADAGLTPTSLTFTATATRPMYSTLSNGPANVARQGRGDPSASRPARSR